MGIKQWGHEADQSPPFSAKVKNAWHNTSFSPICLHGMQRDNFTFIFKNFSTSIEWWILVNSAPILFPLTPHPTLVAFRPKIKYLVTEWTKVSKHLMLSRGTKCCLNCSLVGLLILLNYTNECFIHFHHFPTCNLYIAVPISPMNYVGHFENPVL
jgi:hypothetical protein